MMKIICLNFCYALIFICLGCGQSYDVKYYESGAIKSRAQVKDGVYDGEFKTYYPDGNLKSEGFWKNGIGNGYIVRYFQNSSMQERSNWKNGALHGQVEIYYPEGGRRLKANYKNGLKDGDYIVFNKSGAVSELYSYNEGVLYYLVKHDQDRAKQLELFFPVFEISNYGDSLMIDISFKIRFNGEGVLTIGDKIGNDFIDLTAPIAMTDTITKTIAIKESINADRLYYKFRFIPHEKDTINGFFYEKKVLKHDSVRSNIDSLLDFT